MCEGCQLTEDGGGEALLVECRAELWSCEQTEMRARPEGTGSQALPGTVWGEVSIDDG